MSTATQQSTERRAEESVRPTSPAPHAEPGTGEWERGRAVIPPAVLAKRMQRYSVYLMVAAFAFLALNFTAVNMSGVLWFAAGLCAGFAIMCAATVVILNAIAWNFARLTEELRGGRGAHDMR